MRYYRLLLVPLAGLLVFLVLAALRSVAWAQGAEGAAADPNVLTRVTELAFQILAVVATVFAMWAANKLIKLFEDKTKMDIPERQEALLQSVLDEGIHYASEQGYKLLKDKTGRLTGPQLLETAGDYVLDEAYKRGLPELGSDYVRRRLEARLGIKRANGGVPRPEKMLENTPQ